MSHRSPASRILALLLLLLPLAATADSEGEAEKEALPFSDLSFPEPARHFSAEQKCVQPVEEMRKNHMNYILHQRDETVHEGIRTRRYALEECVNCHTAQDDKGKYIPINAPDQFCYSCHSYASVKIDCFECHATKPVRPSTLQTPASTTSSTNSDKLSNDIRQLLASEGPAQ